MTHDDALKALADHPHIWRYGQLCAEDNPDIAQRDAYRGIVIKLARGESFGPPAPIAVDYTDPSPRPCGGCPGAMP